MLLAGDIGGTKVHLAIFSTERDPRDPLLEKKYPSDEFPDLEAIVADFLALSGFQVKRASFGVAGPVLTGEAQVTNLSWVIRADRLCRRFNLEAVYLINDLESIANAVPLLGDDDLHMINPGEPAPGGAKAVIAPGTGLGEAFLTWDGERYLAYPSEGGHTDFAPKTEREIALLRVLQARFEHVSYERICSGIGIPNIYGAFKEMGIGEEPQWLADQLAAAEDPTPLIVSAALREDPACDLCRATLDAFISILGSEASNLALKILARGGVYLGGGIPPKILPKLEEGSFMQAFLKKGRLRGILEKMPVSVILNESAAIIGAASYGLNR